MKKNENYVEGFILPVAKKNLTLYKKSARAMRKVWLKHGALDCIECMGDNTPLGKVTSFPQSVKLKKDEVVFFSWVTFKNRKHRDQVMKKMMNDPSMAVSPDEMGFDGKRMFWGGFKVVVK